MTPIPDDAMTRDGDALFAPSLPPRCGWLSPCGRFVPCIPWGHGESAWEILRAMDVQVHEVMGYESNPFLFRLGWIKVARRSRGDRRREGGRFVFETPRVGTWTPAQLAVEASWMALDAVEIPEPKLKN